MLPYGVSASFPEVDGLSPKLTALVEPAFSVLHKPKMIHLIYVRASQYLQVSGTGKSNHNDVH